MRGIFFLRCLVNLFKRVGYVAFLVNRTILSTFVAELATVAAVAMLKPVPFELVLRYAGPEECERRSKQASVGRSRFMLIPAPAGPRRTTMSAYFIVTIVSLTVVLAVPLIALQHHRQWACPKRATAGAPCWRKKGFRASSRVGIGPAAGRLVTGADLHATSD